MIRALMLTVCLIVVMIIGFANISYGAENKQEDKPLVLNFFEFGRTSNFVCTVNKQNPNELDCLEQRRKYEGAEFFRRLMGKKM